MTKKEKVLVPNIGMKVFHEDIYDGKELMEIVGLRKNQVELEGDFSGGTNNTIGRDWFGWNGLFRLRKVCPEHEFGKGCSLSNIHCQYPDCEPYLSSDHCYDKDGIK